jgi:hypothetical protein
MNGGTVIKRAKKSTGPEIMGGGDFVPVSNSGRLM